VSYNTHAFLDHCLESVLAQRPREVIVVDNASTDGSAAMVAARFPGVALRANKSNRGFGAAANQAISMCSTPYILLLNADTRLHSGTLEALATYLDEHPSAGIVGPRLLNMDGTAQPSYFPYPTPLTVLLDFSRLRDLLRWISDLRGRWVPGRRGLQPRVVPWVLGAALGIRKAAFDAAGGFDEGFFMYCEETDLCYRLETLGWKTHFTPAARVWHVGGASTAGCAVEMAVQSLVSRVTFGQRHFSPRWRSELRLILVAVTLGKLARDKLRLRLGTPSSSRRVRIIEDIDVWRAALRRLTG